MLWLVITSLLSLRVGKVQLRLKDVGWTLEIETLAGGPRTAVVIIIG